MSDNLEVNKRKYPNSYYLSRYGFYIPSFLEIKKSEMDYIAKTVNSLISDNNK